MEECTLCGKKGTSTSIPRCSRCKVVRYCSRDCQSRDWLRHKVTCKEEDSSRTSSSGTPGNGGEGGQTPALAPATPEEGSSVDGESPTSNLMTCQKCKRKGKDFKKCSRCKSASYCSRDCQRGDWKDHKVTCKAAADVTSNGGVHGSGASAHQSTTANGSEPATTQQERNRWANLFGTLYQDPWEVARSRALAAFPGNRVADVFGDLDMTFDLQLASLPFMPHLPFMNFMPMPFMPFMQHTVPFMQGVSADAILVVRVLSSIVIPSLIPLHGWLVEDSKGNRTHVMIGVATFASPHFRQAEVEEGHFLCVRSPQVIMFDAGGAQRVFIMLDDLDTVRAFKISKSGEK